jgi:hypothetical protein
MRSANGIDRPCVTIPVCHEGTDTHDRMKNVFGEFVAKFDLNISVTLAFETSGSRETP